MIDLDKKYMTRNGKDVVLHGIGYLKFTFPVKGSIVLKKKPIKTDYQIWTIDGSFMAVGEHKYDLIEKEK